VITRPWQAKLHCGLADLTPRLGGGCAFAIKRDDESVQAGIVSRHGEVHDLSLPTAGAPVITIS
jgi:hypothetical protein